MTEALQGEQNILHGISFADYRKIPRMNASTLLWGLESMQHLKAAIDGDLSKDSEPLRFGRAVHSRLLEPKVFREQYEIIPPCQALLKSGLRTGEECGHPSKVTDGAEWFCGKHTNGQTYEPSPDSFISQKDAKRIQAIHDSIKSHDVIKLLRQHGGFEVTLLWEIFGVPIRSRLDKLIVDANCPDTIIDIKKCKPGGGKEYAFKKAIAKHSYHIRAAMQFDAVETVLGKKCNFIWIVVEDSPPHSIAVYESDQMALEIGRWEYLNLIHQHNACKKNDEWPGWTTDIEPIGVPPWKVKQFENIDLEV